MAHHINWKELQAVHQCLLTFQATVQHHNVWVQSDIKSVVALFNRQGTVSSPTLHSATHSPGLVSPSGDLVAGSVPARLAQRPRGSPEPSQPNSDVRVVVSPLLLRPSILPFGRSNDGPVCHSANSILPFFVSPIRDPQAQ